MKIVHKVHLKKTLAYNRNSTDKKITNIGELLPWEFLAQGQHNYYLLVGGL